MTRFTVLGASGYIGSRLSQRLQAAGHDVWAPGRDADLFDRSLGHVVYCIGLTGDFRERPFDTVEAHVSLLANVLRRGRFDTLLYLSSTRVYLGAERTDETAHLTVQPHDPSHLYNLTKLAGEALCHSSGRTGVRVARLSNVIGPDMDAASGNFVAMLLRDARAGYVTLQSDPRSAKDYIHIDDVLELLPRIAVAGRAPAYNVASGVQTTHAQWLEWLAAYTGCSVAVQPGAALQQFPSIDVRRLQEEFGFAPRPLANHLAGLFGERGP